MQIVKFRVWDYKSIVDLGDCYPTSTVTALAGKNESGKTSILEALENFNADTKIPEDAVPINRDAKPKISITFRVEGAELETQYKRMKISAVSAFPASVDLTIEKSFPDEYSLVEDSFSKLPRISLNKAAIAGVQATLTVSSIGFKTALADDTAHEQFTKLFSPGVMDPKLSGIDDTQQAIDKLRAEANLIKPEGTLSEDAKQRLIKLIQEHVAYYFDRKSVRVDEEAFLEDFLEHAPHFILFNSFEDVFPNTIPLNELDENEWIADLKVISNINVETIKGKNRRSKKKHKEDLNIKLNKDYEKFWHQDFSKLNIEWDNEELQFWVVEDGEFYEPKQRSQGRRWHLAFYIKVTARSHEGLKNIILIDEPGLYLHANAQTEVLSHLEELATRRQIFYSTHSPYLLEADKLERIRLIQKSGDAGTTVENKLHKVSDKETLTPLLTAIGLALNKGIDHVQSFNNVICEGPSDYYYLNAFKKLLGRTDLNFIFGGGSSKMQFVGTILQGWGCKIIYLFDNDQGYKDAVKDIKRNWVTTEKEIITQIGIPDGAIEDVFSRGDYAQYVVDKLAADITVSNSAFAKDKANKRDKVLDAKLFRELVDTLEVQLTDATRDKATELFDKLARLFSENYK